jgi:hypothetical protein
VQTRQQITKIPTEKLLQVPLNDVNEILKIQKGLELSKITFSQVLLQLLIRKAPKNDEMDQMRPSNDK